MRTTSTETWFSERSEERDRVQNMSRSEMESRLAEIIAEERGIAERQYRYGYMADRMYCAELFQEKMSLARQLASL